MPDISFDDQSQQSGQQQGMSGSPYPAQDDSTRPNLFAADNTAAVDMIRRKLHDLYADEPDAAQELAEAEAHTVPASKHQQYMYSLHASGKSLVEIQQGWHAYYQALPEHEKYEVWQEFYVQQGAAPQTALLAPQQPAQQQVVQTVAPQPQPQFQPQPSIAATQAPIHEAPAEQPQYSQPQPYPQAQPQAYVQPQPTVPNTPQDVPVLANPLFQQAQQPMPLSPFYEQPAAPQQQPEQQANMTPQQANPFHPTAANPFPPLFQNNPQPTVQPPRYEYQHAPHELPEQHILKERAKERAGKSAAHRSATRDTAATAIGSAKDAKDKLLSKVRSAAKHPGKVAGTGNHAAHRGAGKPLSKRSANVSSLLFGLSSGAVVVFILMFGFFNELFLAPIYQPSRKTNDTPVIVNTASAVVGNEPKVIIPKINLEIPVDYSQTTTSEAAIELALDNGVVHYPTTAKPGEIGNAAFFGHSSNNIFNPGKYKFAFVLLHELVEGDIFYLTRDGKVYAYKVFSKQVVKPSQVSVLNPIAGHPSTATLITCDPPGTSINRLVVVGDQISPDPNTNGQSNVQVATAPSATDVISSSLPGNGPSLWSRLMTSIF